MGLSLLLLLCDSAGVLLAQSSTDGAGLLRSEVEGKVLLLLVKQAQLVSLVGVDDCENASDRFAEVMSVVKRPLSVPASSLFVSSHGWGSSLDRSCLV